MSKQEEYYEVKSRAEELEHAKEVSDQILYTFYGINPHNSQQRHIAFPGLREARAEQSRLLDEWAEEEK
jgi:hypothetical protein